MKKSIAFLLLLCPLLANAVTRSVSVSAPSQVTAGQTFLAYSSASTDASDSEQIGFYHGFYSTNGGSSWNWFTSDVNAGKSASRNAWITAGGAGSTIIFIAKIAFRGGGAGDVDYNGNAINWGGSWDANQSPPAKIAYISVVAPPNQAPTITWTQAPGSAYVNQWTPVQARGNDPDGNLSGVYVWREWVPLAFNGGGNGYENYSDANGYTRATPGGVQFQAQAGDSAGAGSGYIYHTINYSNRNPTVSHQFLNGSKSPLPVNGSGDGVVTLGPNVYVRVTASDPDGALTKLVLRMNTPSGGGFAAEEVTVSGGTASHDFGPYNFTTTGTYDTWTQAQDTGADPGNSQGQGWATAHTPNLAVTNTAPSGTFTLNGTAANATVNFGQTVAVMSSVTDIDNNLTVHSIWWDQGNGSQWTHPFLTWNFAPNMDGWINVNLGSNGYAASGGSSTRSFDFRAVRAGTYAFHNAVSDPQHWVGVGATTLTITVNKATPSGTFPARTINSATGSYSVRAADLNATFANPYSSLVSIPTGAVTYSVVAGGSGAVITGTILAAPGTYTIRASYPGDTNYQATTKDAVWTLNYDANADSDGDGLSDGLEAQLGTNASANNYTDDGSASSQNLKVHKPN